MQQDLEFKSLAEFFYHSLAQADVLNTVCLEVIRSDRKESFTFGQLKARASNLAAVLHGESALAACDKAAIVASNRLEWDVVFWASVLVGAVPVLIDPERPPRAVMDHVTQTDSNLIFTADDYGDQQQQDELKKLAAEKNISVIEMNDSLGLDREKGRDLDDELFARTRKSVLPDDTAVIVCTSGTTGDPREVELTNRNLLSNIQGTIQQIELTNRDKLGHITPPHHSFGLTVGKLMPLRVGAPNIYTNKYRRIPDLIREKRITLFVAIPTLFTVIARKVQAELAEKKKRNPIVAIMDLTAPRWVGKRMVKKLGWESLRFFVSGAAPMPHWVLKVFWRYGIRLYQGYGTTENSPVYGFCEDGHKLGSVGTPIPTMLVRILDEDDRPVPAGKKGEITLGGPCIMKGYYKNPKSTEAVLFTDARGTRWLRTGDLGYLDDQGYLYITGRKKFIIVLAGGKNVSPELVESALSQALFVGEILVVPGFEKDAHGETQETVKAIVQPAWEQLEAHTGIARGELAERVPLVKDLLWQSIKQCQQGSPYLSHFERVTSPRHLEITLEEFEKTSTGKIKRQIYLLQQD